MKNPEMLLEVKNLSVGIRKKNEYLNAVEDISFSMKQGEILGIVGESGSGKTLTALSIPSLLGDNKKVMGGSIVFSGRNFLGLSEKELSLLRGKEISMIFQEPFSSLNPLMKAGAQIGETLLLHGEKDRNANKTRITELMKRLRFREPEKILDAYPHRLSGGMCQRVMIALAVICGPKLLIADEPTTALDQDTQSEILSLLKEINRDMGTSILIISHDLELIKNIAHRTIVIYSGRILEEGGTDEVLVNPAHEYSKGLLNSIPRRAAKGKDLKAIPGKIPSLEEGHPRGCPFHPRCEKALPVCGEKFPEEIRVSPTHISHCILEGEKHKGALLDE